MTALKYLPHNTLAYLLRHPVLVPRKLVDVRVPDLVGTINVFKDQYQQADPVASAMTFYAMNDLVGKIRQKFGEYDPLPEWAITVIQHYVQWLSVESRRMLSYLAIICNRESRHLGHHVSKEWRADFMDRFGSATWKFLETHWALDELEMVGAFLKEPPQCTLSQHVEGLVHMFNTGLWGGAVGGPAWGAIAETLARVVRGDTSLEVMLDTAYTLAHNCGPMFNKGHLYSHHTPHLITVLDVQRAGMMPELIKSKILDIKPKKGDIYVHGHKSPLLPPFVHESIQLVNDHLAPIPDFVDWQKVEDLGSVQKYGAYKKLTKELAKNPVSKYMVKKVPILPGVYVQTITREGLKAMAKQQEVPA